MSTVTWDAILVTVDGFAFGTLTGESCLKNVHCHTDRASWDAILVTVVGFGALMWKKCAQWGGGGGYHWRGGGVGEPRTGIIYIYREREREREREKCAQSHRSGVLGRDPRDSCRFWSPHVEKVCTVGRVGGGIPLEGGGGRRTENRDHIYIYIERERERE